jgi:hypothetical protein
MSTNPGPEITYDEAAQLFECSPRQARNILKQHEELCPPRRYGHRTVRFPLAGILAVNKARRAAALIPTTHENTRRQAKRGGAK